MPSKAFVIGPKFTPEEIEQHRQELVGWLLAEGVKGIGPDFDPIELGLTNLYYIKEMLVQRRPGLTQSAMSTPACDQPDPKSDLELEDYVEYLKNLNPPLRPLFPIWRRMEPYVINRPDVLVLKLGFGSEFSRYNFGRVTGKEFGFGTILEVRVFNGIHRNASTELVLLRSVGFVSYHDLLALLEQCDDSYRRLYFNNSQMIKDWKEVVEEDFFEALRRL